MERFVDLRAAPRGWGVLKRWPDLDPCITALKEGAARTARAVHTVHQAICLWLHPQALMHVCAVRHCVAPL